MDWGSLPFFFSIVGSGVLSHRLVLATVGGVGLETEMETDGGQFLIVFKQLELSSIMQHLYLDTKYAI